MKINIKTKAIFDDYKISKASNNRIDILQYYGIKLENKVQEKLEQKNENINIQSCDLIQ